jgi:RimJ/RimL family protein N-acetyltransferase
VEDIRTERLSLRLFGREDLLALIDGAPPFEMQFGMRAADGLGDFYTSGDLSSAWVDRLRASTAADVWFHGFAVIHPGTAEVIGTAGFKGGPDADGMVEIAYGIAPGYQNHGYAAEVVTALVAFAFQHDEVRCVRAHTLPNPNASTRVLAKCGFTHAGEVIDPEDGAVWRWERQRP